MDEMRSSVMTEQSSASTENSGDYCMYNGRKYAINERIEDGCERICKCMASTATVECEARCPKHNETSANKKCVSVPDPKDSCCQIELCDVTDDDDEQSAVVIVPPPPSFINAHKNRTSSAPFRDHEDLIATTTIAATNVNGNKHGPKESHNCEHNGSKYTIGMSNEKKKRIMNYNILFFLANFQACNSMKAVNRFVFARRMVSIVKKSNVHRHLDWKSWIHIAWNGLPNRPVFVRSYQNVVQVTRIVTRNDNISLFWQHICSCRSDN